MMALFAAVYDTMLGVQTEITIFLIALCMHTILFRHGSQRSNKLP